MRLRVVRWSAHYDDTVVFYRDIIGLPVLETFQDSYGLDGTILGMPGSAVHLEIVRLTDSRHPVPGLDQLVLLPAGCRRPGPHSCPARRRGRPPGRADRLLGGQRWRYLPGSGRARSGIRILDLHAAGILINAVADTTEMSDRNVLGGPLEPCGTDPVTGFYRDGCCTSGPGRPRQPHDLRGSDGRVPGAPAQHRQRSEHADARVSVSRADAGGPLVRDCRELAACSSRRRRLHRLCWRRPMSGHCRSFRSPRSRSTQSTFPPIPVRSATERGRQQKIGVRYRAGLPAG